MQAVQTTRRIVDLLATRSSGPTPRVRSWEGSEWGPVDAAGTLVLRHPGALRSLLSGPGDLAAGDRWDQPLPVSE